MPNTTSTITANTHTIRGREIPDSILLENGIHFTEQWMKEQDNARPYLPENKLRYWAAQIAKTISIRTTVDGCTHDERRPTTQEEHEVLYNLAYSALLGLNAGEAARQTTAAEDAILNAIEYTCILMLPEANSYLTIYCPLRNVLEQWRSHPVEELPVIASDFPRDQDISYHVEYSDGSEGWEGARFCVAYEGKVFEGDGEGLNHWHTDSSDLAHELYNYCELRGLDPRLDDEHYGVSLYRGEWY